MHDFTLGGGTFFAFSFFYNLSGMLSNVDFMVVDCILFEFYKYIKRFNVIRSLEVHFLQRDNVVL